MGPRLNLASVAVNRNAREGINRGTVPGETPVDRMGTGLVMGGGPFFLERTPGSATGAWTFRRVERQGRSRPSLQHAGNDARVGAPREPLEAPALRSSAGGFRLWCPGRVAPGVRAGEEPRRHGSLRRRRRSHARLH